MEKRAIEVSPSMDVQIDVRRIVPDTIALRQSPINVSILDRGKYSTTNIDEDDYLVRQASFPELPLSLLSCLNPLA